jgi:hypothetical protein
MKNGTAGAKSKRSEMTPAELHQHIQRLSPSGAVTEGLTQVMSSGEPRKVWYSTQKEHLSGWLAEYDGPGYYGRSNSNRTAEFVYNHFNCAPGLLWLAEAAGVPRLTLVEAKDAVLKAGTSRPAQSAALRRVLPLRDHAEPHRATPGRGDVVREVPRPGVPVRGTTRAEAE